MHAWLARAGVAARLAADHGELWVPAALAWVAFLGWLPFVLAVARPPNEGDLTVFGAGLATSGDWPVNAIRLAAGLVVLALIANTLVAVGEAGLLRLLDRRPAEQSGAALLATARRLWIAQLVGSLPAVAVLLALLTAGIAAAVGELQSPDIGGSAWMRVAVRIAPLGVALLVALVAGQAFVAAVARRPPRDGSAPRGHAFAGALRDLAHRPLALLGVALASLGLQLAYLAVSLLLLRVLWAPIGEALANGRATTSAAPLLLVGFVAIWLCLVLVGGALHAFVAAWWSLELGADAREEPSNREEAATT
ncbi:MAG: hypothetical protein ABJB65_03265 [Chloroflexota bacterium]